MKISLTILNKKKPCQMVHESLKHGRLFIKTLGTHLLDHYIYNLNTFPTT